MCGILRYAKRLWAEDDGFIISAELVLIATILVLALVVGLSVVRDSISAELVDVANAFGKVNQSNKRGSSGKGGGDAQLIYRSPRGE